VLPFSTGVIMEPMPWTNRRGTSGMRRRPARGQLGARSRSDHDDRHGAKALSRRAGAATVTGIAKARDDPPGMATMLGFVATDAAVSQRALDRLVTRTAARSFNRISVDGDTSTNDSFILIATGAAGAAMRRCW